MGKRMEIKFRRCYSRGEMYNNNLQFRCISVMMIERNFPIFFFAQCYKIPEAAENLHQNRMKTSRKLMMSYNALCPFRKLDYYQAKILVANEFFEKLERYYQNILKVIKCNNRIY